MVDLSNANGGYFANPENMQVKLVTDGYTPSIMTTDISGTSSGQSPLHEFFKYTTGATFARSDNGNWYDKRNNPDQSGKGSSGGAHQGIDILTSNKNDGTATLYRPLTVSSLKLNTVKQRETWLLGRIRLDIFTDICT